MTPDSKVNSSKPDAVLFALDYRALPLKLSLGDAAASPHAWQGVMGYLAGAARWHQDQLERGLHLSNLRSSRRNAVRQPGPRASWELSET